MNILVIGNGFDLAHNLPTKYADFLNFIQVLNEYYKNRIINFKALKNPKLSSLIKMKMEEGYFEDKEEEWTELIEHNFWIKYFIGKINLIGETWIDFENEILQVIKEIENELVEKSLNKEIYSELKNIMKHVGEEYNSKSTSDGLGGFTTEIGKRLTYEELREFLVKDLNKLIRAFELYLVDFIEKLDIEKRSPDFKKFKIDKVISFNYTNTYERLYAKSDENVTFDYIHGKANDKNTIKSNNMVLGVDEYLAENIKDINIEFIEFKKYFQRIYKETGCEYKNWIEEIKIEYEEESYRVKKQDRYVHFSPLYFLEDPYIEKNQVFVYGHSLNTTDKDVLKNLILNDNIQTTIFYHSREAYREQIANLVQVIGQEELIRRTGGVTKTITFKQQEDLEIL